MLRQFSWAGLWGGSSRKGCRASRRTLAVGVLLLGVAMCAGPLLPAQSGNPIGALLGKGSQPAAPAPATVPAPPAPASAPTAIPLPEVSMRAEELSRLLRDLNSELPTRDQLDELKKALGEQDEIFHAKHKEVEGLLAGSPSPLELREQQTYWHSFSIEDAATRRQLLDWANAAQSAVQRLQSLEPQWTLTLEENQSTPDLGPTLEVIRSAVKSIRTTETQAQDLLRVVVNLQVIAANHHQLAMDVVDQLARMVAQTKGHLLQRDSLPLWQLFQRRQQGESPDFLTNANSRLIGIAAFAQENSGILAALAVVLLLSMLAAFRLAVATRGMVSEVKLQTRALEITRHWLALGLLLPLFLAFPLAPTAPLPLIGIVILFSFFSILVLLPPLTDSCFHLPLYCLVAVYLFNAALNWLAVSPAVKREVQFTGCLLAVIVFAYLLRPRRLAAVEQPGRAHKVLVFAARASVAILGLGQLVNLLGYYKLAQFLTIFCIYSTFIALAVFTVQRVSVLLFLAALEAPSAERLALVRLHKPAISRWTPRLLQLIAALIWLTAALSLLGARIWTKEQIARLLDFKIVGGSSNITLGGVLGFWAILLFGFAFSSSLRFLLREELLKRLPVKRGIPELISTTVHYLLLLLVFLFAVNAGGVALNKFTVITGALGVGVGFGLQNIINNFVSGLILQFERPIRVGDVVEIQAGLTGTVTRIGIRSSTVLTFQGAEVIIPNATFISSNVTNWTLSEAKRRIELPVGVAYGTDPKIVRELLERPAVQHPDVLVTTAPVAYFKGFGDSALNFELQFWVMQESNVTKVNSEVALEVMRLLSDAGIEIPFPQRDLHVRGVDAGTAGLLTGDGIKTALAEEAAEMDVPRRSQSSLTRE